MPCAEHQGIWCSRFFGRVVLRPADAQDATVARALGALRDLQSEAQQTDAKVRELETRKRTWESRKDAFEQRYQNVDESQATDLDSDGRSIATDGTAEVANAELEVRDALQAIRDPEGGAAFLAPLLHIPYHDPAGRCPCYQRKLRQLAVVQSRINTAQLDVVQRVNHLRTQIRQAQLLVAAMSIAITGVAGLLALLGVVAFKAALVILLLVVIALLAQIIMLLMARAALTRARARLLRARLLYYRLQHVSTCLLPFPGWDQTDPPGTGDGDAESSVEGYLEELDAELTTSERQ
jgi:hypothetical protein